MARSLNIPFDGFYESWYSQELDAQEEQWAENEAQEREIEHPQPLRLNAGELCEAMSRCRHYRDQCNTVARDYVDAFSAYAADILGFPLDLEYEEMTSPREYNFETDRIFAKASDTAVRKMFFLCKDDPAGRFHTLTKVIKSRFTSYDGFISHYSNDLERWLATPLRDWDHNELGTLLLAALAIKGIGDEWRFDIFSSLAEGSTFYTAFDGGVDWAKLADEISETREEKAERWREENPDAEVPEQTFFPHPDQLTLSFYKG